MPDGEVIGYATLLLSKFVFFTPVAALRASYEKFGGSFHPGSLREPKN